MALDKLNSNGSRPPKAAEQIATKIKRRIVKGELAEGELLPPEVRLMEEFGVSRPTIREAFRILETEHLVSVSRGARGGAVVHRPDVSLIASHTILALAWEKTTVAQVYETRVTVEPAVVRRVAEVAHDRVEARLQPVVDRACACVDDAGAGNVAGILTEFLDGLLELADNQLLKYMYLSVREITQRHQALAMNEGRKVKGDALTRVEVHAFLNSYQKVVRLMAEQRADEAERHWRHHVDYVYRTWVRGCNRYVSELFSEYD